MTTNAVAVGLAPHRGRVVVVLGFAVAGWSATCSPTSVTIQVTGVAPST